MPNPVIHFDILGKDAGALQKFYGDLFDWKVDNAEYPDYGIVSAQGEGIGGGIGCSKDGAPVVSIYIKVDDLQQYLDKVVSLGGKALVPPTELGGGHGWIALFEDPEGNTVGLWSADKKERSPSTGGQRKRTPCAGVPSTSCYLDRALLLRSHHCNGRRDLGT